MQSVPDDGRDRGERLAFTGLHLGNVAALQRERAEDLDIEHAKAENARGNFRCEGEDLDHRSWLPTLACGARG